MSHIDRTNLEINHLEAQIKTTECLKYCPYCGKEIEVTE